MRVQSGDVIEVIKSEWYALKDGQRAFVCEMDAWLDVPGKMIVPDHQRSTFWGPSVGCPRIGSKEYMSTSGGPFMSVPQRVLDGAEFVDMVDGRFWCWKDLPRAGGGVPRIAKVRLWRLPLLADSYRDKE